MYRLYVLNEKTNEEKVLKFETVELALLYRDYHLTFGTWSSVSKWVSENEITEKEQSFIVDSRYIEKDGLQKLFYKVAFGLKIKVQKEESGSTEELWAVFRKKRQQKLQETDWTQLADAGLDTDARKEYRQYRAYLRDVPSLHNDSSVIHAKVYSFEDWKKGKR
jgi:DNA primase large subunit